MSEVRRHAADAAAAGKDADDLEVHLDAMHGAHRRAMSMSLARVLEIEFEGWRLAGGEPPPQAGAEGRSSSPLRSRVHPPKGWELEKMIFNRREDGYGHSYSPTASDDEGGTDKSRSRSTSPVPQPYPTWATPSPRPWGTGISAAAGGIRTRPAPPSYTTPTIGNGGGVAAAAVGAGPTSLASRLSALERRVESLSPVRGDGRAAAGGTPGAHARADTQNMSSKMNFTLSPSEVGTYDRGPGPAGHVHAYADPSATAAALRNAGGGNAVNTSLAAQELSYNISALSGLSEGSPAPNDRGGRGGGGVALAASPAGGSITGVARAGSLRSVRASSLMGLSAGGATATTAIGGSLHMQSPPKQRAIPQQRPRVQHPLMSTSRPAVRAGGAGFVTPATPPRVSLVTGDLDELLTRGGVTATGGVYDIPNSGGGIVGGDGGTAGTPQAVGDAVACEARGRPQRETSRSGATGEGEGEARVEEQVEEKSSAFRCDALTSLKMQLNAERERALLQLQAKPLLSSMSREHNLSPSAARRERIANAERLSRGTQSPRRDYVDDFDDVEVASPLHAGQLPRALLDSPTRASNASHSSGTPCPRLPLAIARTDSGELPLGSVTVPCGVDLLGDDADEVLSPRQEQQARVQYDGPASPASSARCEKCGHVSSPGGSAASTPRARSAAGSAAGGASPQHAAAPPPDAFSSVDGRTVTAATSSRHSSMGGSESVYTLQTRSVQATPQVAPSSPSALASAGGAQNGTAEEAAVVPSPLAGAASAGFPGAAMEAEPVESGAPLDGGPDAAARRGVAAAVPRGSVSDATTTCSSIEYDRVGSDTTETGTGGGSGSDGDEESTDSRSSDGNSVAYDFPGNPVNLAAQDQPIPRPLWLPPLTDTTDDVASVSSQEEEENPNDDNGPDRGAAAAAPEPQTLYDVGTLVNVAATPAGPWIPGAVVAHRLGKLWVQPQGWTTPAVFKHVQLASSGTL